MLAATLKARATQAMKDKDTIAMSILRLALGEIQTAEARSGKALSDDEAAAVVRKLLKSNEETLSHAAGEQRATLEKENDILRSVLPAGLTPERIAELLAPVISAIQGAASDGQAIGIAMKHLKAGGAQVQGNDVAAAVKKVRGG
jgi:uncharacterized protein YqeY